MFDPTKGNLLLSITQITFFTIHHAVVACTQQTDCKFKKKCPSLFPLTEIMSGDLLDDLMSSEGEFVYRQTDGEANITVKVVNWCVCNKQALEYISAFWLMASFDASCMSQLFLCLFFPSSVLASPPPVPPTQRPRLHIQPGWDRRPVWPLRRPHSQPLTPEIVVSAGSGFLNMLIYLFLQDFPPVTDGDSEKRCRKAQMMWWAFKDTCTDTVSSSWPQSESSSTYSLVKKYRREQNILITAFPMKHC